MCVCTFVLSLAIYSVENASNCVECYIQSEFVQNNLQDISTSSRHTDTAPGKPENRIDYMTAQMQS